MTSFLQNTGDEYFCHLPENIGFLSNLLLKLFFSGIVVNKDQTSHLQHLHKTGAVVYVTKHKSYFLYLFYYIRYKLDNLPFPQIGFDYNVILWQPISRIIKICFAYVNHIVRNLSLPDPYEKGYIGQELTAGRPVLFSLIEKKGFYRRFVKEKTDPIRYLVEVQKTKDRPNYLIPQLMFFDKDPQRSSLNLIDILFGTKENPGKLRRLVILFRNPGRVFVELSEPINLKIFLEVWDHQQHSDEYLALILRRNLLVQINRHRQSITGPVLKTRDEIKENILTSERLQNFMEHYSSSRDIPIKTVHKKANAFLDEIAAKYNMVIIKTASVMITWILNIMFDGVTVDEKSLSKIKSISKKGPLILIPCHKSHIDYLILSYLLYHNNMPCPHVAAGKNLSFWPIGPLFRGAGAFFIRRSFRGAILYSKVFAEYIHNLLAEGFNIEFFIEGGRSRTGKLILPKLGLLSILLNSFKNNACEDMIFAPIFIGYDRILEESSYVNEIEGEQKQPESLVQVVKARKFLKKRYGRIYIQFHEPISLKELLEQYGTPIEKMTSKELNILCRNLGHRMINAINNVSVVTPHALVAAAAMNCSKKSFTYDHFLSHVETYMNYLVLQKAKLADTLIIDHAHAVEHAFENYIQRKFIERVTKDKEGTITDSLFKVNENKRPHLEYYKNNCISFFISGAMASLAILVQDAFQFSAPDLHDDYEFIQYFFKYEFAYDVDITVDRYVRKNLKAFIDDAIIMPHPTLPDIYNLTSSGFRKLKLFSSFLKTYFESYWVVLNFFMQTPQNSTEPKDRLKKIEAIGSSFFKKRTVERKEALSRINYSNGIDFFTTNGVKGLEDKDKIEFYADKMQKYLNYI
ncbi:MAG: 1-acyl-sn-glycerol-3-phosphate acyltransferase [Desulfobacterales bacterium]|nr:MAG: 1-acyl-sn-glycerol-3-phosphate acyltransferase [Desulfobacterales bacterium]